MPVSLILPEGCTDETPASRPLWAASMVGIAGSLFVATGMGLTAAGIFSGSDSSAFDLFGGLGLVASGVLLARRSIVSAGIYLAVLAGTLIWSLRDLGLGGSSLVYRLIGPMIILSMILALTPALLGRGSGRRLALVAKRARIVAGGSRGRNAPYLQLPCPGVLP